MQNALLTRTLLTVALLVTLTACVSTRHTFINPSAERFAPVPEDSVWIITSEAELDTISYVRVAIIEASGSGGFTSRTEMLDAMRKRAGEIGANAILLPEIQEPNPGVQVAAAVLGVDTRRTGTVVAIRILGRREPSPP
jgi:hypothetical protein